jgi:tetratricopeptide (TPR) repeat protein
MGAILTLFGQLDNALALYEQSLKIYEKLGDRQGEGATFNNLATIVTAKGDYNTAFNYLQQSLIISQQIGDRKRRSCYSE